MLSSLIVVFREALEAGLVVGIVLAATAGIAGRHRWICAGAAAGLAGAAALATCAQALSGLFDGTGQEIFTAAVLGVAVVMLGWHVTWMSAHARSLATHLRAVGQNVRLGTQSLAALATVVGIAVLREGVEVVLFLSGIAMSGQQSAAGMLAGGVAGLLLAAATSYALYRGLVAIPLRRLFQVTNWLILLLAAGMAGRAAAVLHSADLIPGWGERLWNTSWLIDDASLAGRTLQALIGYSARPPGVQVVAWAATLILFAGLARVAAHQPRARASHVPAVLTILAVFALGLAPCFAADMQVLTFRQHRFYPDHIVVATGQKIRLEIHNADDTADEFESTDLGREKLVTPGGKITIFLGPLDAGSYQFFGDFHRDTAHGVIEVK